MVPSYLPATRYGGPIYSVHGLCKSLNALGHDVHVFTTNIDGGGESDVPTGISVNLDGVKVWYFRLAFPRRLYWSRSMARALQEQTQCFDLVHLHSVFLWPTWAAARMARRAGVPYVLAPRGMLVEDLISRKSRLAKGLWIKLIERKNLEHAAAIHCTSDIEETECRALDLKLPRLVVIPNGAEIGRDLTFAASPRSDIRRVIERQPLILFLGRISWKKGLDRLIPALQRIPEACLAIAGNDDEDYSYEVITLAERSGVANRITLLGAVSGVDKAALYQHAKVFVLTSYSENFGNAALEALTYKCPVIITPEVGVASTIEQAGAGRVVDGKPEKIAEAIKTILDDDQLRTNMGLAGARLIQEKYQWDKVAQQMEAEYQLHISSRYSQ